ncbi:MAG: hypothetical protein ACRYGF_17510 [Janthinobacterium lividum]
MEDLIARYVLEPTLRDVYVEGAFDESILRQFFKQLSCDRPSVTRIDLVEITDQQLQRHGLTRGEKSELIALAEEVHMRCGVVDGLRCVTDTDSDRLLGVVRANPLVLQVDFTCMEMYWLNEYSVGRFFEAIRQQGSSYTTLLQDIGAVGREMFLIRSTVQSLNLNAGIIPFRKYCSRGILPVSFDSEAYIAALLNTAGATARKNDFLARRENLRSDLSEDLRLSAHGHDLLELILIAYRDRLSNLGLKETKTLETVVAMTMPLASLTEHNLFKTLSLHCC